MSEIHKTILVTIALRMIAVTALFSLFMGVRCQHPDASDHFDHPVMEGLRQLEQLPKIQRMIESNVETQLTDITNFVNSEIRRYLQANNPGEAFIVMLKMFSILHVYAGTPLSFKGAFSIALGELFKNSTIDLAAEFRNNQDLSEHLLDWNFHLDMLHHMSTYHSYIPNDVEWISQAYLLVIENSPHLKHSFTKGMLLKLNKLRNRANANNAMHLYEQYNNANIQLNDIIRFPFDKIMIELELFDRNDVNAQYLIQELKRFFIEESLTNAVTDVEIYRRNYFMKRGAEPLFTALLELPDDELTNYGNELGYALGWYGKELNTKTQKRLDSMLRNRCKRLVINGFPERLQVFEFVSTNMYKIMDEPWLIDSTHIEYYKLLFKLSDYPSVKMYSNYRKFLSDLYQLAVFNPETLNDHVQLREYDQYHIDIFESDYANYNPKHINDRLGDYNFEWCAVSKILSNDTRKTFRLLDSITTPIDTFDARNRIRIFIRFIMHLCNAYRDEKSKYTEDIVTIPDIASIYIKLMRFGADILVKDVEFMHVWYRFTKINPKLLSELLNEEMIESLIQYNNAANPSKEADAVLYIFLTRIANFLAENNRFSDGSILVKRILELEKKVGYADDAPIFIRDNVSFEKQLFYIYYSNQAAKYRTNLSEMVEHHIELITSFKSWPYYALHLMTDDLRDMAKRLLLDTICTATINDHEDHLIDLSDRLRYRVHQLINGFDRDFGMDDVFAEKVRRCEQILGSVID